MRVGADDEMQRLLAFENLRRDVEELRKDFEEFRTETRARNDKQDKRQEQILWALVMVAVSLVGTVVGAALTGMLPS